MAGVPVALIMKFDDPHLEVFVSSQTDDSNPYEPGASEIKFGLYCETVIESQKMLDVPNALVDPKWDRNPDIKFGMINYLGIPINWPNGQPFGTICILDRQARDYSELIRQFMVEYANVIENYLELIYDKQKIERQSKYIKSLNAILPLCAYCRKLRTEDGEWVSIEKYAHDHYDQETSHGICPECLSHELENQGLDKNDD